MNIQSFLIGVLLLLLAKIGIPQTAMPLPLSGTWKIENREVYITGVSSSNGKAVIMGFCWGGSETFRFVTNNAELQAGLVFYGSAPNSTEEISRIGVPVYGFYGGNDQRINAGIPETEARMIEAGKVYDYVIYPGAGHGYMRQGDSPDASPENCDARDASWERIIEILSHYN